ncbi:type II toxin-antitoxin system VapC family toxin, partial [Arthrospira platensis SPKY1]|nr:type II toxin-antitoxin system VapC family toxin [Arthrospira platensis SPKY1]
ITIDTSALLAVLLNEPSKAQLIALTRNHLLVAPSSLDWEVGNALSALFKRQRISLDQALEAWTIFERIPIRREPVDMALSLQLAYERQAYAYDMYMLSCSLRFRTPLLSLDNRLNQIAHALGIPILWNA